MSNASDNLESCQKKRAVFSLAEKELIVHLIDEREDKYLFKTRDNSKKIKEKKDAAWQDVFEKFMSSGAVTGPWTLGQIKDCFRNLTKKAKSDAAEHKKYSKGTGGGPPLAETDNVQQLLTGILGDEMKCLDNPFDSDAGYHDSQDVLVLDQSQVAENEPSKSHDTVLDNVFTLAKKKMKTEQSDTRGYRHIEHNAFMEKLNLEKQLVEEKLEVCRLKKKLVLKQLENSNSITTDVVFVNPE